MSTLYNYLKKHCYALSATAILELYKTEDTFQKPLFVEQTKEYCGIKIFKQYKYNLLYIDNKNQLSGLCLELSTRQSIETRTFLVLEFCKVIAKQYRQVNFLEAFNSFQLKSCLEFEKYGYNTFTESFDSFSFKKTYKRKKTLIFPTIDILNFYKWYFDFNKSIPIDTSYTSVLYLLYCYKTHLIKICESTISRFNKSQILELNPNCGTIAYWKAPSYEESKLTHIFKNKEHTNFWYHFSFDDLQLIKDRINSYIINKESIQSYKWAI